jgi:hypothetical protein
MKEKVELSSNGNRKRDMAELTTTNGTQYIFTPAAIVAVSDRDQTCILGLTAGVIQIGEPVATFLQRI